MVRPDVGAALYTLIYLPLGATARYSLLLLLAAGTLLSLTFLGLPFIALVLNWWRQFGRLHRWLADRLLGEPIAAPHRLRPATGRLDRIGRRLGDVVAWRAVAYQIVKVPQSLLAAAVCLAPLTFGLWSATYPIWWRLAPQTDDRHKYGFPIDGFYFDTWPRAFLICVAGLVVLAAWPWLLRAVLVPDRLLARGLLGPVRMSQQVSDLEQTRALAVEDAAATVRKIERDLHDGAQARLVSLAMSLTLVQDTAAATMSTSPRQHARRHDASRSQGSGARWALLVVLASSAASVARAIASARVLSASTKIGVPATIRW